MASIEKITETDSDSGEPVSNKRLWLPSLGLRVSERKLLLLVLDLALLYLALIISLRARTELLPDLQAALLNAKWFVTLAAVWWLIASIFAVYELARAASTTFGLWAIIVAVALCSGLYMAIPWLTPPIENRSQAFLFGGMAVLFVSTWRLLYANLFVQPAFERRALIVGAGRSGRFLIEAIRGADTDTGADPTSSTGHRLIGFVDDATELEGTLVGDVPVLGDSNRLLSFVDTLEIDEIVIAISDTRSINPVLFEAFLACRERGIPVVTLTSFYEKLTGRVAFEYASQNVEVATGHDESPFLRMYQAGKRLVDITGALLGLALLVPLTPIVFLINLAFSPGNLLYKQRRVGRSGQVFDLLKFRSMVPNAEAESGAVWAEPGDHRVTKIGRLLRRTHLDELPQVINVLRGQMSLVGPRPERPEFVEDLVTQIPYYRARHSIRPGITGWAQIHQDYGDSVDGARQKLEYDLYYIKHAGPMLDLVIILRTVATVLGFRGR